MQLLARDSWALPGVGAVGCGQSGHWLYIGPADQQLAPGFPGTAVFYACPSSGFHHSVNASAQLDVFVSGVYTIVVIIRRNRFLQLRLFLHISWSVCLSSVTA